MILLDDSPKYQHYTFLHNSLKYSHDHSRPVSKQLSRFITGIQSVELEMIKYCVLGQCIIY